MKKKLILLLTLIGVAAALCALPTCAAQGNADADGCFSQFLSDAVTGTELYSYRADEKHQIASMVKIMTATLTLESVACGELAMDEMLTISQTAAGMGGSQMFLDAGQAYPVRDLLKGLIVASANDASVALAERIDGSHEAFVAHMNTRAAELGMRNTVFCNATGLPSDQEQYSTARDVNIMTRQLMSHPEYYEFAQITLEDYVHPSGRVTQLTNTNKLLRAYQGCVGGKTGFTNEAGFCLSACAERNQLLTVATVIGAPDSKTRFRAVSRLFDYGFANYSNTVVCKAGDPAQTVCVGNSRVKQIECTPDCDLSILTKKGESAQEVRYDLPQSVKAPIRKGDVIGTASVQAGEQVYTVNLIAMQDAPKYTWWEALREIAGQW